MTRPPVPIHTSPAKRFGFTLVEVALALAVLATAMVGTIGMLPTGLSTLQQARAKTIEAQIVQGLANDLNLTHFGNLRAVASDVFAYDFEGKAVEPGSDSAVYKATISLNAVDDYNLYPVRLQTGPADNSLDEGLSVQIRIENKVLPQKPNVYSFLIANNNI